MKNLLKMTVSAKAFLLKEKLFLILFAFSFFIFFLWFLAYFPGAMSPDSIDQWMQAHSFVFNNWHPYLSSLYVYLLTSVWDSPGSVALFQITFSAFLVSYFSSLLIKRGAPKAAVLAGYLLFVFSLPIGNYNLVLWKDIIFAQMLMLVMIIFVKHYFDSREQGKAFEIKSYSLILLALLISLTSLLRHNAIIFIAIVPLSYLIFRVFTIRKTLILLGYIIFFVFFFKIILFNALKVHPGFPFMKEVTKVQLIGSILNDPQAKINEEQKKVLLNVLPIDFWKENYTCKGGVNPLIFNPDQVPNAYAISNSREFAKIWNSTVKDLIKDNPQIVLKDRVCLFNSITKEPGLTHYTSIYYDPVYETRTMKKQQKYVLIQESKSQILKNYFDKKLVDSVKTKKNLYFYWGTYFIIIFYAFVLGYSAVARDWFLTFYVGAPLAVASTIFVFGVATDYRYLYVLPYSLPFIIPLFAISFKNTLPKIALFFKKIKREYKHG